MNTSQIYKHLTGFPLKADYQQMLALVKQVNFLVKSRSKNSPENTNRVRHQIALKIAENGRQDFGTLCQGPNTPKSRKLLDELKWHLECSIATASTINKFNASRKEFGSQLLLGNYAAAEKHLSQIQIDHGISLYYLEKSLLLEQARNGTLAARKLAETFASRFLEPGHKILTNLFRLRTEGLLLQWPFEQYLKGVFELNESEFRPFIRQEMIFYSDSLPMLSESKDIIALASRIGSYSTIDKYLATLRCLRIVLHFKDLGISKDEVGALLRDASAYIVDDHINCLLQLADRNGERKLNDNERSTLELQGLYLRGDFVSACENAQTRLTSDSTNAILYDLIAKSLIHSSGEGGMIDHRIGGLARRIILLLVNLYSEKGVPTVITSELDAIAVALGDNHLSHFVRSVAQRYRNSLQSEYYFQYGALNQRGRVAPIIFERSSWEPPLPATGGKYVNRDETIAINYGEAMASGNSDLLSGIQDSIHPTLLNIAESRLYAREANWNEVLRATEAIASLREKQSDQNLRWIRQLSTYRLIALLACGRWAEARELLVYCIQYLSNFIYIADSRAIVGFIIQSNQEEFFELELLLIRSALNPDFHLRALLLRNKMKDSEVATVDELLKRKDWYQEPLARSLFLHVFPPDVLKYIDLPVEEQQNSTDRAYQEFISLCVGFIVAEGQNNTEDLFHQLIQAIVKQRERTMKVAVDGARFLVGLEPIKSEICSIISSILDVRTSASIEAEENYNLIDRCFELLRTEYLYGKYGFTRSLGTRVRHGFFFNEFFDAFEESGLCAKAIGQEDRDMVPPDLEKFGVVTGSLSNQFKLDAALLSLTRSLLSIIENFRDGEISMRRHDSLEESSKPEQKSRYFSFDSLEGISGKDFPGSVLGAEEIFDWGCSIIRRSVEESLSAARNGLLQDFRKQLTDRVEEFESAVIDLHLPASSEQMLVAKARDLAGNLIAKCQLVSNWFKIADKEVIENAAIIDVLNAVAKSVQARQGSPLLVQVDADRTINWREVDILFNVLYILADNARKASISLGEGSINLYVKAHAVGLEIGCRNRVTSSDEADRAVRAIVNRLQSFEPVRIMDLGGTGLIRARDLLADFDGLVENLSVNCDAEWVSVHFIIKHQIEE